MDQNIRAMTPFTILLTRRLLFPIILVLIQRRCLTVDTACCFFLFFFFAKASFCAVTHAASIAPLGPPYTHKYTISEHTHHTRPLTPHPIKPYTDLRTQTHTHCRTPSARRGQISYQIPDQNPRLRDLWPPSGSISAQRN